MIYEQLDPTLVWDALGDGDTVVCAVLDDMEHFHEGVYTLNYQPVNTVIEMINQENTIFFIRKGE